MDSISLPLASRQADQLDRLLNVTQPRYQLQAKQLSSVDRLLEIWQMPCM